jgi:hypothetical protein
MTMTMNTSKAFNINNLSKISAYETIRGWSWHSVAEYWRRSLCICNEIEPVKSSSRKESKRYDPKCSSPVSS